MTTKEKIKHNILLIFICFFILIIGAAVILLYIDFNYIQNDLQHSTSIEVTSISKQGNTLKGSFVEYKSVKQNCNR
ncbi:MAG TPA: hypothetical protein QF753_10270 [Victivallales bacterium]|nr:hypothetical protein [Victivallales bacterium]